MQIIFSYVYKIYDERLSNYYEPLMVEINLRILHESSKIIKQFLLLLKHNCQLEIILANWEISNANVHHFQHPNPVETTIVPLERESSKTGNCARVEIALLAHEQSSCDVDDCLRADFASFFCTR